MYDLLKTIDDPADLRALDRRQLQPLADELRAYVLDSVSQTGGHLSSNLGTVELTIALHYVFDTPTDRIVWDVGHQTYPHKILTGRRDRMPTLRQLNGISGFPRRSESEYDTFGTAHSSTSISAALGMAVANKLQGDNRYSIAVIGDEPRLAYNRVLLSSVLAGETASHDIELKPANWWRDRRSSTGCRSRRSHPGSRPGAHCCHRWRTPDTRRSTCSSTRSSACTGSWRR